ncbi:MAG: permease [Chloroflexales bacterium]|nr:permease [Chloroflexales bacterium]
MKATVGALILTLAILMCLALWQGTETFANGWNSSLQQLLRFLPTLVIAMLIAGFTETLIPQDIVERWLSDSSGWRGIGIAWLAGILTPGGGIIGLPLIAALYQAGVGVSVLMTYATSFATLSILRIPLEVGFYGWRLTAVRIAVSLCLPLIAGGLTQLLLPLLKQ